MRKVLIGTYFIAFETCLVITVVAVCVADPVMKVIHSRIKAKRLGLSLVVLHRCVCAAGLAEATPHPCGAGARIHYHVKWLLMRSKIQSCVHFVILLILEWKIEIRFVQGAISC